MIYLVSLPDYKNNFNVNGNTIVCEGVYKKYFSKKKDRLFNLTGKSKFSTRLKKIFLYIFIIFLKNKNNNKIYTTMDDNYGFYLQIFFLKLISFIYDRVIIHHHSFTYISKKSSLFKLLSSEKFIHISISEKQKKILKKNYNPQNIYLIKNNAFVYKGTIFKKKTKKKLKIIYFSALTEEKGIYDYLNLTKYFLKKNIEFFVYGNNCNNNTLNDIKEFKKKKFIINYRLNIYNKDKAALFKSTDILIFPSKYKTETTPMVIDESINFQVVPIAYDVGSIKEQLEGVKLTVTNFILLKKKLRQVVNNYVSYQKKIVFLKKKKLRMINKEFNDLDNIFLSK